MIGPSGTSPTPPHAPAVTRLGSPLAGAAAPPRETVGPTRVLPSALPAPAGTTGASLTAETARLPPGAPRPGASSPPTASALPAGVARPPAPSVAPTGGGPSLLQGTVRKPVQIDDAELQRLLPGVPPAQRAALPPILSGVVLETYTSARAAAWGESVQRAYADHADAALTCARAPALEEAHRHLARLHTILGQVGQALDPDAPRGWSLFRRPLPLEVYQGHAPEIDQLRRQLQALQPSIERVHADSTGLGAQARTLRENLEHHTLAAQVLVELLQGRDETAARVLVERGLSLARAASQLRESEVLRAQHAEQVAELGLTLRDVILGTLPAWIEQITYTRSPTPTDSYHLHRKVEEIRSRLRP